MVLLIEHKSLLSHIALDIRIWRSTTAHENSVGERERNAGTSQISSDINLHSGSSGPFVLRQCEI